MELRSDLWHVRMYYWSLEVWGLFGGNVGNYQTTGQTNICHYIRTIFVAMPLVFFLHGLFAAWVLYVVVYTPGVSFGWFPYLVFWVLIGGCVGIFYMSRYAMWSIVRIETPKWLRFKKKQKKERASWFLRFSAGVESFMEVLWIWMVAQKRRICPLITITRPIPETQEETQ